MKELRLTTLAERRVRGDLIETFKVVNGLVNYGQNVFGLSRSGRNIVSKSYDSDRYVDPKVKKLRSDFIPERVKPYWNSLPAYVKNSVSVDMFKGNLETFKKDCVNVSENNFWEVSNTLLEKIEGPSYISGKIKHNEYLINNPYVAKKRNINIFNKS